MPVRGDLQCQGAVFIYKQDDTTNTAWMDACEVDHVRVEVHGDRTRFLAALRAWRTTVNENNSFLLIYSHMGAPGMSPTGGAAQLVTWDELKAALAPSVHTLWLVGCESHHVMAAWPTPADGSVKGTMLVTGSSEKWVELARLFREEVKMDGVVVFDKMEDHVRALLPEHANSIHYYDASNAAAWSKFPKRDDVDLGEVNELDGEELSRALWGDWAA
jgi:hypothetical protein